MHYWRTLGFSLFILILINGNRDDQRRHIYQLQYNQITNFTLNIQKSVRITFVQHLGQSRMKIYGDQKLLIQSQQMIYQEMIGQEMIGKNCRISVVSQSQISKGLIIIQGDQKYQFINHEQQSILHLKKNQQRILYIHLHKKIKMTIERFQGIPSFIVNKCKIYQKKQCYDQMHRFTPSLMKKHIQVLNFQECSNCLVLFKLSTSSDHLKIRISFKNNLTIIPQYPTMILIKSQQIFHIHNYYQESKRGRILLYSGSIELNSNNTKFTNFTNGYFYQVKNLEENDSSLYNTISIKGIKQLSYLVVQYPINQENITLIDGFTTTIFIQPQKTYIINYENRNKGKANIVLSSSSQLLSRISLKFSDEEQKQNYLIKPKFIFNESIASQNFQLDQSYDKIHITMHLVSGSPGFLNISAQVHQLITIPLDYRYSSILYYQQYDQYIIQGVNGNVQVNIQKCVDCSLKYSISQRYQGNAVKELKGFSLSETLKVHSNELYIRIQTGNYAIYSIYITKNIEKESKRPKIQENQIKFYLTDSPEDSLILQFYPPMCNKKICQNVTYFLLQGSNQKDISSKLYCHSQLFDFYQNIKDILIENIQPTTADQLMSLTRPIKHRDFIGIAAYTQNKVIPYRVINIEQVKAYKEIKWPLFFLTIFIFFALFCSFVVFMGLRKRNIIDKQGYKRIPSDYQGQNYQ